MPTPSSRAFAVLVGLAASGGLALAGGAWGATSPVVLQPAPRQDAAPALATGGNGAVVAWTHRNGVSVAALGASDLVSSIPDADASSPLVAVDGSETRYVAYTDRQIPTRARARRFRGALSIPRDIGRLPREPAPDRGGLRSASPGTFPACSNAMTAHRTTSARLPAPRRDCSAGPGTSRFPRSTWGSTSAIDA